MAIDDPAALIEALGLEPHPEGGWFRQTWAEPAPAGQRPASTAIYYLLRSGETSRWHRVDATEVWHHYAGAPLELRLTAGEAGPVETHRLGANVADGDRPQLVVAAGQWQTARSLGAWTLAGCTVAPGFTFDGFELARDGWQPSDDREDR
jgi:predicted cupin superfamily sugar epimerase